MRHYDNQDWHSYHIPVWEEHITFGTKGLEIGSFEGRSACWLLDNTSMHLTCIDNWSYISGSEKTFDNNVKEFGGRVRKLKMDSAAGLSQLLLEKASFSFVYVDGCHEGFTAVLDMLISWRMLMVGGFMVVDDIRWTDPKVRIPPRIAWKAFALLKPPGLEVVHVFRQVIARKTCM